MRVRLSVVVAMVATALALSGCSVKAVLDKQFAPDPKTVTVEATIAVPGASVEGTITEGFPETVALWPGAVVAKSKTTKTPQGASYSTVLNTPDPYDDVLAGVGEGLKQAAWKVEAIDASNEEQKVTLLTISNEDADGIVTVTSQPDKPVRIEYVITPK